MSEKKKNIELRSEEVQEILGKIPSFLTRWGITVVFFALAGLVAVAAIVKYPDLVQAEVMITTNKPPVPVVARIAGNIQTLYVEEGEFVEKEALLGILQNTSNEEDVFLIEERLNIFLLNPFQEDSLEFPESLDLGKLQNTYSVFRSFYKEFQFFEEAKVSELSIDFIQQQITQIDNINRGLINQLKNCNDELNLLSQNLIADKELLDKGIISTRDYQSKEALVLQKKASCETVNIELASNSAKKQDLQMQIFNFATGDQEAELLKFTQLRESANQLSSEIKLWKEQFLLVAPVSGTISFNDYWSDSRFVSENEEILSIIRGDGEIRVSATLGNLNIGKVAVGQEVNMQFPAYNYMEFGLLKGTVKSLSAMPRDDMFQIEIELNNGLITTYDREIEFRQGMKGTAEVITEKRTILDRIFDKLKFISSRRYQ